MTTVVIVGWLRDWISVSCKAKYKHCSHNLHPLQFKPTLICLAPLQNATVKVLNFFNCFGLIEDVISIENL